MPLRPRLERIPQTIQRMELAAGERYLEAVALLRLGHRSACVYLAGYSAEMLLKCSCFLWAGAHPHDRVSAWFGPAVHLGGKIIPWVRVEKGHSLLFWATLLRARRRLELHPLQDELDLELDGRSNRLYENWWSSMRYLPDPPTENEALCALDDVFWIKSNYIHFWR